MSPLNATDGKSGRFYTWNGEQYWSVTSIIGGGVPKPALVPWASKLVAEAAVDGIEDLLALIGSDGRDAAVKMLKGLPNAKRDSAGDVGSAIHASIEAYSLGAGWPEDTDEKLEGYLNSFRSWLEDFKPEFEVSEASVYNRERRYAGTLDAIVVIDGKRWLLDWKTSKGIYAEVGLQLAAYRHAEFIGMPDGSEAPMPEVDDTAVIHITPTKYEFIPVRTDEEVVRAFYYAREVHRWSNEISKSVLSKPLVAVSA